MKARKRDRNIILTEIQNDPDSWLPGIDQLPTEMTISVMYHPPAGVYKAVVLDETVIPAIVAAINGKEEK